VLTPVVPAAASAQDHYNRLNTPAELTHRPGGDVGPGVDKSVLAISEARRIRDKAHLRFVSRKPAFAVAVSRQIPIIYGLRSFGRSVAK
jgi:hypothetical protein